MKPRSHTLSKLTVALLVLLLPPLLFSIAYQRAEAQRRRGPARRRAPAASQAQPRAPLTFSHRLKEHQLACDKCHKFPSPNWKDARKGSDAFADATQQPEHASCLSCHQQQFFARERPAPRICSVCHVAVSPRDQTRLAFPNPPEKFNATKQAQGFVSDFRVGFPHDKHLEVVDASSAPEKTDPKSCGVCHQLYQPQGKDKNEYVGTPPKDLGERFWLKKGTFRTIPNHSTCFTCHSQDSGIAPAPNDCNACHKLAPVEPARADFDPKLAAAMGVADGNIWQTWRRRDSSGTFRHEGGAHPDQSCTACHDTAKMNTLDRKTMRVPVESCNVCHITATAADGGALNIEADQRKAKPAFQCTKCHITYGREPMPATHTKAIEAAK
jgi:Cytochrome c7 and related cytochrome c